MRVIERVFDCEYASESGLSCVEAGYIDKTVPGCGLTSLAIEVESGSTVIAVPSMELVENKVGQYPNGRFGDRVLGVTGETGDAEIASFVSCRSVYKIMVTYDSIGRVEHLLGEAHLVIDESDRVLSWEVMKSGSKVGCGMDVMNRLLGIAERYRDTVSFISATPVPVGYFGRGWMEGLDRVCYRWTRARGVSPILMERAYPLRALREEVLRPLSERGECELGGVVFRKVIVFYNSVSGVERVVGELGLPSDECGIKCGNSVRNSAGLSIRRLEGCDGLPKYTFVTSSGFSGIDLYDAEAMTVVVSSTGRDWQMVDMRTDLVQAVSRQRDKTNPHYGRYVFIYNQTVFKVSDEELRGMFEERHRRFSDNVSTLNEYRGDVRYGSLVRTMSDSADFRAYVMDVGVWEVNELRFNADRYFIEETRRRYLRGFSVMDGDAGAVVVPAVKGGGGTGYGVIVDLYRRMLDGEGVEFSDEQLGCANMRLVDGFYRRFGKLEANGSRARRMMSSSDDGFARVKSLLRTYFSVSRRYTAGEVRELLQRAYDKAGVVRRAKAMDFLELVEGGRRVKVRGVFYYRVGG